MELVLFSRRRFLRFAGSLAVGAGVFLASNGLAGKELLMKNAAGLSASLASEGANNRASLVSVKVYYTMMAQYTDLSEEDFVLQSPATIQDLISTCVLRHPWIAQMTGTMLILLDGMPSTPATSLKDGDTVQFIPMSAGG